MSAAVGVFGGGGAGGEVAGDGGDFRIAVAIEVRGDLLDHVSGVVVNGGALVEGEAASGGGDVVGGEVVLADGFLAVGVGEGDALADGGLGALEAIAGVGGDDAVAGAGGVDAAAAVEGFGVVVGVVVVGPAGGFVIGIEGDGFRVERTTPEVMSEMTSLMRMSSLV